MTSPVQSLEDAFQYNSSLARAQLSQFPAPQRPAVAQWLEKLGAVGAGLTGARRVDALRTRNDYTWFLLLVLRGGRLTEPFRSPPPPGSLPPLHQVLPDRVYEDVLSAAAGGGGAETWAEKVSAGPAPHAASQASLGADGLGAGPKAPPPEPRAFLASRPAPKRGGVCLYMGAFSAQD